LFTPIGGDGSGDCDNEEHCIISLRFYPLKGLLPIPDIGITAADIFTIIFPFAADKCTQENRKYILIGKKFYPVRLLLFI